MTCPCGRPLDMGVDHGDTETGDPICATCCPDCNPKGPQVNEPLHKITYTQTHTSIFTREAIELRANNPQNYKRELVEACRQWLAEHPEPLTKEQLDRLPPGTIIGTESRYTHVKGGDDLWWEISGREVFLTDCTHVHYRPEGVFVPLTDDEIREWANFPTYGPEDRVTKFIEACREATA